MPRPNVLLLFSDQFRFDAMHCAGNAEIRTPNLDALAASGVRFTQACTPTPVCVAARMTLAFGQRLSRHRWVANRKLPGPAPELPSLMTLLHDAGYTAIRVSPRMVYVDSSKPELVEGFTKRTFTAMIEGVRVPAIEAGIAEQNAFEQGIRDLHRTTEADGVFCYTFFKAIGYK